MTTTATTAPTVDDVRERIAAVLARGDATHDDVEQLVAEAADALGLPAWAVQYELLRTEVAQ